MKCRINKCKNGAFYSCARYTGSYVGSQQALRQTTIGRRSRCLRKIALEFQSPGTGGGVDNVDSRLYNQSAGMDCGFGAEDEDNA